jgi:demethylmenaquinone methyltransferase/2-methoxy-6-polyprenyl-1,4-benzoquinol methylase
LDVARLGEIYSRTAAFYDATVAAQQASAKLAAIEVLARRRGERFVEVGVGTGWAFGRILAASGVAHACGLDVAAGMLAVALDVLASEHGIEDAPLVLGDARHLPFADASLDCVLNTYTFEVLPEEDISPVLRETLRVLRPGGRIVIVNLTDLTDGSPEAESMIEDWTRRYAADPEAFGGARPLQLRSMLEAHGFERVTRRYVGPDWPSEVLVAYRPAT